MKKIIRNIIKLIILIIILIGAYYYEDIEKIIKENNQGNVSNIVNPKDNNQNNISNIVSSTDNLEIYYLDVGNADSILIRYHNNNVLIDAGNNEDGEKLVNYFKSLGVENFKYVIGTHAHEDHIGGMDNIINSFNIEHFYMPSTITTTKTFEDVIDSLTKKNIKFETPKIDYKFNIEDIEFKVLYIGDNKEDLNKTSIILKMTYKETNYLFTGDATSETEKEVLNKDIKSKVLKVAHHGSQYSSTAKFLNEVKPKYAIIEVGKNNDYGHPKKVVLQKLEKIGAEIYRTDQDGTIHLISDGKNIKIEKINTDTNGG